jgi:hypothetical protein
MLGDNTEKPKNNPLRIAQRRRNPKRVVFTDPIYYDHPGVDWSSDDEGPRDITVGSGFEEEEDDDHQRNEGESEVVKPLKTRDTQSKTNGEDNQSDEKTTDNVDTTTASQEKKSRASTESTDDDSSLRRENRARKVNSSIYDSDVEPKKISLTPDILREENTTSGSTQDVSCFCTQNLLF